LTSYTSYVGSPISEGNVTAWFAYDGRRQLIAGSPGAGGDPPGPTDSRC
jgi:hypothetical protein